MCKSKRNNFEDKIVFFNLLWLFILVIMLSVSPLIAGFLVDAAGDDGIDSSEGVKLLITLGYCFISLLGSFMPFLWRVRLMYPFSASIPKEVLGSGQLDFRINILFWLLLLSYVVSVFVMYLVS
jgi:hypothetical protein